MDWLLKFLPLKVCMRVHLDWKSVIYVQTRILLRNRNSWNHLELSHSVRLSQCVADGCNWYLKNKEGIIYDNLFCFFRLSRNFSEDKEKYISCIWQKLASAECNIVKD